MFKEFLATHKKIKGKLKFVIFKLNLVKKFILFNKKLKIICLERDIPFKK